MSVSRDKADTGRDAVLCPVVRGERRLDVVEFMEVAEVIEFDAAEFIRALAKQGHSSMQQS